MFFFYYFVRFWHCNTSTCCYQIGLISNFVFFYRCTYSAVTNLVHWQLTLQLLDRVLFFTLFWLTGKFGRVLWVITEEWPLGLTINDVTSSFYWLFSRFLLVCDVPTSTGSNVTCWAHIISWPFVCLSMFFNLPKHLYSNYFLKSQK